MALSYSSLGVVDRPDVLQDSTALSPDLRCVIADVTIGTVTADYVSSLGGLAFAASQFGLNTILFGHGVVRASSATLSTTMVGVWDANLSGMKLLNRAAAGSAGTDSFLKEIVATDRLAAGDIVRCMLVGR